MRLQHSPLALCLIAALLACTAAQDESADARPVQEPAPAEVAEPMAGFAGMVGGEWKMTVEAGTSMFDTWHWGPGKRSLRVMTHGDDAEGNPWRALGVVYWHPGRKQVCLLGLNPYERSVSEGTITFEGESAEAVSDLYQTGVRRKIVQRWAFEGPDEHRFALLEAIDPAGLTPMVEFTYVRSRTLTPIRPPPAGESPEPSEHLKPLVSLLGHAWETTGEAEGAWAIGAALHIQSTFEWVPYANGIYVRVLAPSKEDEPTHLFDAYVYHHTGTGALRCLALSSRGGVHEGYLAVLDGGALQLDLTSYTDDQVVPHVVRFDFETDGSLRNRVWSLAGTERTLMLDVHHEKLEPKED